MYNQVSLKRVIQPFHFISKIFGLAPLNLGNLESTEIHSQVIPFLISFLFIIGSGLSISIIFESNDDIEKNDIIGLTLRAEFYLSLIMMGVNIFLAYHRQNSLKQFLQQIYEIDTIYNQFNIKVTYENARKSALIQVIDLRTSHELTNMYNQVSLKRVIQPFHFISKIFGLAPLNLGNLESTEIHSQVIPFLISFLFIIGSGLSISIVFESNDDIEKNDIIGLTLRAEFYLSLIMMGVNIFLAYHRQNSLKQFLQQIYEIDTIYNQFNIRVTYENARKSALIQVIGNIFIFFGIQSITILNHSLNATYLLIYTAVNLINFLNTTVILQFANGVLLIWQRFKWLNFKIEMVYKDPKFGLVAKMVAASRKNGMELIDFSKLHDRLCDISKLLNSVYSIQLLISMAVRFIMIIAQLIKIYKILTRGSIHEDYVSMLLGIVEFVLHVFTIFLVTNACSTTENEAKRTAIILHKIWDQTETLKIQVKYFSLQMHHQFVKFTACGFFDIDFTVIYGIIGAVTTYLIIVIQFDLSRQESSGDHNTCSG